MIKDRILQIVEYKKLKKEDFYKKIGMTSASFRGKAKETPINSNAIANILLVIPEINLQWLLTGHGKMIIDDKSPSVNFNNIDINIINTLIELINKDCLTIKEKEALKAILNQIKDDLTVVKDRIESINK